MPGSQLSQSNHYRSVLIQYRPVHVVGPGGQVADAALAGWGSDPARDDSTPTICLNLDFYSPGRESD